jgi:UDP-N-acetyl-2-amino-2-deoxyglucuronate dehydrogenase
VYRDILAGGGFGIEDARPSIQLAYDSRSAPAVAPTSLAHPLCYARL